MWQQAIALWRSGTSIGLRSMRKEPALGLKRLVLPVSYWRTAEFAYVIRRLRSAGCESILDLGSPKELAIILAESYETSVYATDLLPSAVELSRRYCVALGVDGKGRGMVYSEVQDGRALTYGGGVFDAAISVSVLEHIPNDGDSRAITELVRVVKPGGRIVVTVPYAKVARDTFVDRDVYDRTQHGDQPVFFQRHYDRSTLQERLVDRSRCRLENMEIWREGPIPAEATLSKFGRFALPLAPLQPFLAAANLRQAREIAPNHVMAAFFTLVKPHTRSSTVGSSSKRGR